MAACTCFGRGGRPLSLVADAAQGFMSAVATTGCYRGLLPLAAAAPSGCCRCGILTGAVQVQAGVASAHLTECKTSLGLLVNRPTLVQLAQHPCP